jgi:ketosteroid isomerase-like protein
VSYAPAHAVDVEEIRALSHRYALALDRFDMNALLGPFTEEVVFDLEPMGLPTVTGCDELRKFMAHTFDIMATQMHLFANQIVDFDGPDDARGTNYLFQDGYTKHGARVVNMCLNQDRYVRTPDGWRIASRRISPLVPPQLEGYEEGA